MDRRAFLATGAAAMGQRKGGDWEWRMYAADASSSRYAPLDEINASNVAGLEKAWEFETLPEGARPIGANQATPIVVDGVLYTMAHGLDVFALEAATGKRIWQNTGLAGYEAQRTRAAGNSRGVTYWKAGSTERIFAPVRGHILAIDARTGKMVDSFGEGGAINLRKDLGRELEERMSMVSTTPGVVVGDVLIVTSRPGEGPAQEAPGHIRAYDCKTGKLRWIFHTIPHPGEFGYETWPKDAWQRSGWANCWGGMSVDEKRGLVFLATGSPTFDFWGGDRHGENLFGNCVLCLNAQTGKRVWHFQTVHHDLFDWDLPCAPNLVTVRVNGRMRDAVAQVAKTGWIYLLDRETGKPLYPIEERPVPASTVAGEKAWPTQPFPTNPPPFSRMLFTKDDIGSLPIEGHEAWKKERLKDLVFAPPFTPPMLDQELVTFPGFHGGALWGGASWVAERGVMFVNHNEIPWSMKLVKAREGAPYPYEHTGYLRPETEEGYPAITPPWARISAIDLHACKILWQAPLGEYKDLTRRGVKPTGTYMRGGNIATKGGVLFTSGTLDNVFRAFDQKDGRVLWEHEMSGGAFATPATYMAGGRQYVVISTGPRAEAKEGGVKNGVTAFALPRR
jgi:quinoprotein glucose dehydrogenase